ncbi:MAG: glycoside hydrolase, partial [Chloroflexota bacterium]|nr:glycoside hydrolase [Chloroflexota bacterium]
RYQGTMAYDASGIDHWYEPGLVRLPDGRLLGLLHNRRFPVHAEPGEQMAPPAGYFLTTISEDDGISWSAPKGTRIWGYPLDAELLPHLDGAVLAAYSHRTKPAGVRVAVSPDGGRWSQEDVFTITPHYDPSKVAPAVQTWTGDPARPERLDPTAIVGFHIGYPSSAVLDDGSVLTAYHLYNRTGRQYVECAIYRVVHRR